MSIRPRLRAVHPAVKRQQQRALGSRETRGESSRADAARWLVIALGIAALAIPAQSPAGAVLAWYSDPCLARDQGEHETFAAHPTSAVAGTGVGISVCGDGSLEVHDPDGLEPGLADLVPGDNGRLAGPRGYVDAVLTPDGRGLYALRGTGDVVATGTAKTSLAGPPDPGTSGRAVALALTTTGTALLTVTDTGDVTVRGGPDHGDATPRGGAGVVDADWTQSGHGYWVLAADGQVTAFGDATRDASPAVADPDRAVAIVHTAEPDSYWVVTMRGRVHTSGTSYTEDLGDCRRMGRGGVTGVTRPVTKSAGVDLWVTTGEGGICAFDREG